MSQSIYNERENLVVLISNSTINTGTCIQCHKSAKRMNKSIICFEWDWLIIDLLQFRDTLSGRRKTCDDSAITHPHFHLTTVVCPSILPCSSWYTMSCFS